MEVEVVDGERAVQPIEFGSIIANKYTILRPDKVGTPGAFICREVDTEPVRSVWALRPGYDGDPSGQAFVSEMARVQKLEHPQLRKLLDFGRDSSGILYAVFEPLEIRNLSDVIEKEWPLEDERVVWLMCQLLATLEVAHAAGLSHGDLRPENVLVRAANATTQNEELVLCGLGLANSARFSFPSGVSLPRLKLADWMVGTPNYAAPEQLRGDRHDVRSDVYGAGLLMFQLLTRTLPFCAANDLDTAFMQCFTPPPPPSGLAPVSPALEAICLKALTKTPDMRYQSANEMRAALLAAQAARSSRGSTAMRVRPSRSSQPRISSVPAEVAAARISDPDVVLARVESVVTAPIEVTLAPEPVPERQRSSTLLLVCCGLAVLAALVLPDLRLGDTEAEPLALEEVPAALAAPVSVPKPQPMAAKPQLPAKQPEAPAPAPALAPALVEQGAIAGAAVQPTAANPAPAPAPKPAARPAGRVARVRLRSVEKSVVAADVSRDRLAPVEHSATTVALDGAAAAPTTQAAAAVSGEAVPAHIELPALEQPPAVAAAPEPALAAPKPIIFSTISPPAPASEPAAPAPAREVGLVISDGVALHGAVSKASLRGALNHAAIASCYRQAVQGGSAASSTVSARLEIATNLSGRITSAKLSGDTLPNGLVRCVEEAARLGRVREADMGEVHASFELTFRAR